MKTTYTITKTDVEGGLLTTTREALPSRKTLKQMYELGYAMYKDNKKLGLRAAQAEVTR